MESASSSWAGRGGTRLISSAFFAPLSPLTPASLTNPCTAPERLLSPRNLRQIPFGARTRFKAHVRHLCAHLMVSNKWVVIVWAHLGRGRIRVHLTPRENTLGHFGLNLVTVSSLRCGAQRCIPFTPYFTFDHRIPKHR